MRYRATDVVDRALAMLDAVGLERLSMRKLAADLGVQPSALYHHFPHKQALLAAVADTILDRGRRATEIVTWEAELRLVCTELRDAMLTHRDGATLIAQVLAAGTGAGGPEQRMYDALRRADADEHLARVGARTLVHFVLGHAIDRQGRPVVPDTAPDAAAQDGDDFATGIGLVLDGLGAAIRRAATGPTTAGGAGR